MFRFFFIYFLLLIPPWSWLNVIPGASFLLQFYYDFIEWAVIKSNASVFQVFGIKNVQVVYNGSGDTSFNWAEQYFNLSVALLGCIIWSVLDRRRKGYRQLNYLLCLLVRYNIALIALSYGFQKIFVLQMPFPLLSNLATPLGDFLPMRLSWLFIGYSTPYEIFSGVMEVLVGLLLLYRRTATMGVLIATAVFINVMMLNLCYDIPVKLYSMNIVVMCLYLLANEFDRIACFFVLNKPAAMCSIYHYKLTKNWMRVTRVILKLFLVFVAIQSLFTTWKYYNESKQQLEIKPIKSGVYEVSTFAINGDTLPALITDTLRWQNVIFEKGGMGSIQTSDTIFRQRYNSLYIELKKSNRHFQLAERQFHWLSEANR